MIKLFATDLDGSLLNIFHEMDPICRYAVKTALEAGCRVAFATGRVLRDTASFGCQDLPIDLIGANGAVIFDAQGNLFSYTLLDQSFVEEILKAFPTLPFSCVAPYVSYIRGSKEDYANGYVTPPGIEGMITRRRVRRFLLAEKAVYNQTDREILSADICKINVRVSDATERSELEAFLEEHKDTVVNDSYDGKLFEIADISIDKGVAVGRLAKNFGFEEDEIAVYGDGHNDISMLSRFIHSYVPKNGSDAAKKAARYIIGSSRLYSVPRHIVRTVRAEHS